MDPYGHRRVAKPIPMIGIREGGEQGGGKGGINSADELKKVADRLSAAAGKLLKKPNTGG